MEACNVALILDKIPETWKEARIIVLPKLGKDPKEVGTYRPISLLNHEAKIFASILARSLNIFISKYVNIDQSGLGRGKGF